VSFLFLVATLEALDGYRYLEHEEEYAEDAAGGADDPPDGCDWQNIAVTHRRDGDDGPPTCFWYRGDVCAHGRNLG